MPDATILPDDFVRQLVSVGEVDVLIGLPTFNNAQTIGHTLRALDQVLLQNLARERVVIVNADGGSRDGTPELVLAQPEEHSNGGHGLTQLRTVHRVSSRYPGHPSFAGALRMILAATDLLSAKSTVVLSTTSVNVTPESIEGLVRPTLYENYDYVAPLYKRAKYDGLLIREALYPFARAAYGRRLRELHAEDCAFSGTFACHCLSHEEWNQPAAHLGASTWMALESLSAGFKPCQVFIGSKSRSEPGAQADVVTAIQSSIGTLFWCLDARPGSWLEKTGSEDVPTFGTDHALTEEPIRSNRKRLVELFRSGVSELGPLLEQILQPDTFGEIQARAAQDAEKLRLEDTLWVQVLYDFAASYHRKVINRDHLLQLLTPLYRGRVCSTLNEERLHSAEQVEQGTEELCLEFERLKPYLLGRWQAGS